MSFLLKSIEKVASVRIQRSNSLSFLKFIKNYSTENKNYSKQFFEYLDSNKDGSVDKNDFRKQAIQVFLFTNDFNDDALNDAFKKLDKTNKGSLSHEDVESFLKGNKLPSEEVFESEFQIMDKDKDGLISVSDMVERYSLDKEEAMLMPIIKREFRMMGKDEHDKITLDEYVGRNLYRAFLANVFNITDYVD